MNILALSPHTDDAELGAGGFLARSVERGDNVTVVAFSTGNPETGATLDEFEQAMKSLDITNFAICDHHVSQHTVLKTRYFDKHRQDILDWLIELRNARPIDLVLVPSTGDIHQDHGVITSEAMRAFRKCSILGYERPWNNYIFSPVMYIPLNHGQMKRKRAALYCYKSQRERPYFDDAVVDLALLRGMQIGVESAEAFEVIRWVMS